MNVCSSLEEAVYKITASDGRKPLIIATDARISDKTLDYLSLKNMIFEEDNSVLILFGTGW